MKRAATVLIVLLFFLCVLPPAAFANAAPPVPKNRLYLNVENAPEEMAYADLLIELHPHSPFYAREVPAITEYPGITAESEIVRYYKDGYVSFTFHYSHGNADLNGTSSAFRIGY